MHASWMTKEAWNDAEETVPAVVVWQTARANRAGSTASFKGVIEHLSSKKRLLAVARAGLAGNVFRTGIGVVEQDIIVIEQ